MAKLKVKAETESEAKPATAKPATAKPAKAKPAKAKAAPKAKAPKEKAASKAKAEPERLQITVGDVTITIDARLKPPKDAGKLSPKELSRLATARKGIGVVCNSVSEAMRRVGSDFVPPKGITSQVIEEAGFRAEGYDGVNDGLETVFTIFKQANRIADADAVSLLSRIHDQVKAQAKDDPQLLIQFNALVEYFGRSARKTKKAAAE